MNSKNEIIKENESSSLIEPLNRKTTTTSPIPIINNNNRLELTTTNNLFKNSPVLYNSSELLVPTSASTNNLNDVNKSNNNNKFYNNSRNDKYDLLFDNSTLDPFHDMELNAINDKEELRNILEKSSLLTNNNNKFNNLEQSNDNFGLPNINFNNNNLNI